MRRRKHILLIITLACSGFVSANAQGFEDSFTRYRHNRINPFMTYWHEFLFSSNLTFDYDFSDKVIWNLKPGVNYGFGIGYLFKIGVDDLPQNLGLGIKAEYFPNSFYKFNLIGDLKILALQKGDFMGSFLGGGELNLTYTHDFNERQMHTILYMLDAQYKNIELKWGLQSSYDKILPYNSIDEAFHVLKLTYKIIH